jgi:hypothetical protein
MNCSSVYLDKNNFRNLDAKGLDSLLISLQVANTLAPFISKSYCLFCWSILTLRDFIFSHCGAEFGCEHRAMSLGTKEINEECDHDEEPPFCKECTQLFLDTEIRMNLPNGKCYISPSELEDAGVPFEEWPKELQDAAKWCGDRQKRKDDET